MRKTIFFLLVLILLHVNSVLAQKDAITVLDEVVLSDFRLYKNSVGQEVTILGDSTLTENEPLLTSLLKFNTPIYFRENGYGMVSSASFRGTTASQTAVVWNGININSQFNGQTDFNTLTTAGYENIAVRAGGGSVLYGSGAIGGSVHLNNRFRFDQGFRNRLRLEYGSFNTFNGHFQFDYSSERTNIRAGISRFQADNDYPYLRTDRVNENGDFYNTGFNAGIAHLLDKYNTLKFYTNFHEGERGFSGTLTAPSKSMYRDLNSRNLLEWKSFFSQFTSSLKLAYLDEKYEYYANRNSEHFDYGRAKTGIVKYDLEYDLSENISLNGIVDYQHTHGEGANVGENNRNIGAFALLLNHRLGRLKYEVSARQEITDSYQSPLLFSLGAIYAFTDFYDLKFNLSRNFRIPAYNDLFWRAGGNLGLKPEESYQAEVGQNLHFGEFEFSLTGYVMQISDLLRWTPDSSGMWRPENTQRVRNYGLEAFAGYEKELGDHHMSFTGTYAFTRTNDENLDKELIYVPKHKATAAAEYSIQSFSFYYQYLYTGSVFTSSDNNYSLDGYTVSNMGLHYRPGKRNRFKIGVEVRNLWNSSYKSLPSRPMPGRSFSSSLTINF